MEGNVQSDSEVKVEFNVTTAADMWGPTCRAVGPIGERPGARPGRAPRYPPQAQRATDWRQTHSPPGNKPRPPCRVCKPTAAPRGKCLARAPAHCAAHRKPIQTTKPGLASQPGWLCWPVYLTCRCAVPRNCRYSQRGSLRADQQIRRSRTATKSPRKRHDGPWAWLIYRADRRPFSAHKLASVS